MKNEIFNSKLEFYSYNQLKDEKSLILGVLFACQKHIENLDKWQVIIFRIRYGFNFSKLYKVYFSKG